MNQKFITNLLFLLFVNVLVKPFYIFGIDRTVQVTVGTPTYGVYFALYNFSILYFILLDLGLTNYNNRTIAQDHSLLKTYLPNFLIIKTLLSFVYLGLVFSAAWFSGYRGMKITLLLPLALNQILISFIFYFRSNVSALHYFKLDALLSVSDRVLMIILCSLLLWGGVVEVFKIEYFIYAQTFAYGFTAFLSFLSVAKFLDFKGIQIKKDHILKILKESYPYALVVLLMTIYNRIDSIMIERLLPDGAEQAGIYAGAYRLLDAVNMFGLLFASLLLPIFAKMLVEKQQIQNLVQLSFKTIFVFSVSVAVCTSFFSRNILVFLYGNQVTAYWSGVYQVLIFSFIPIASVYIFGTLMTANNNLRQINLIAFSGVLLNVLLNLWLIPTHKAFGATIATLSTQILVAVAHWLWANRLLKIHFPKSYFIQLGSFATLVTASSWLVDTYLNHWHWLISLSFSGGLALIFAIALRLLNAKAFLQLLANRK